MLKGSFAELDGVRMTFSAGMWVVPLYRGKITSRGYVAGQTDMDQNS